MTPTMANDKNNTALAEMEKRLWAAADQLWANSPLKPSEYSTPVLGLIFLFAGDLRTVSNI
jgi:type I restriction enzyme M protein